MKHVYFSKKSEKFLEDLQKSDKKVGLKIIEEIDILQSNPLNNSVKKLVGFKDTYRIRVGRYRVIYKFDDKALYILLIAKRDEVYDLIIH